MCPPVGPWALKNHLLAPEAAGPKWPKGSNNDTSREGESIKFGEAPLLDPPGPTERGQEGPQTCPTRTAQLRRQLVWGWSDGHSSSPNPLWLWVTGWLATGSALAQTHFASLAFSLNEFLLSWLLFLASL